MSKRVSNVMEKIKNFSGNSYYSMSYDNLNEIRDNSKDCFHLIFNGFKFGYLQGVKAEKARAKKVTE